MSKFQVVRAVRQEIGRLNRDIDLRIIKGMSYRQQALRHKMLTSQLRQLTGKTSVFGRVLGFAL